MPDSLNHRFCVAPMIDWTVKHCRNFHRMLTRHAVLYTEMITTGALLHGDVERHLRFYPAEHPLALQLGGSDPGALAECAAIGESYGYDEINLNVGCPSDRVQSGTFGACLMANPEQVRNAVIAMAEQCRRPITVKCRLGIDDQDEDKDLEHFINVVSDSPCAVFILHARKAWLQGLSPKENRDIPPLNYARVYRLKQEHPALTIILNGGISTLPECDHHLQYVDGVMLGRAAYQNPYLLSQVDQHFYGENARPPTRGAVVAQLIDYIDREIQRGSEAKHITRHILGLYQEVPGAKRWRRHLSQHAHLPGTTSQVVREALTLVEQPQAC